MILSGDSRTGPLLAPDASGLVLFEHGTALAKVLGMEIHGDASAKRRSSLSVISLSDRDNTDARRQEGKLARGVFGDSVAIAAGCGDERRTDCSPGRARHSAVAIAAGCGDERRVYEFVDVAIAAGCGGERSVCGRIVPVAIAVGCGGERRLPIRRCGIWPRLVAITAGCGGERRDGGLTGSMRTAVAIAAGCDGECRINAKRPREQSFLVAIAAGCGGECRKDCTISSASGSAISAGCGGERTVRLRPRYFFHAMEAIHTAIHLSGMRRTGPLLAPDASGSVLFEHGAALAKVLGNSIHGDASAKRRSPFVAISLSDRDIDDARSWERKCARSAGVIGSSVAIAAGCGGERRDDTAKTARNTSRVAIAAGCGGERRNSGTDLAMSATLVAIAAGCGGECRVGTIMEKFDHTPVAIAAGCGSECRLSAHLAPWVRTYVAIAAGCGDERRGPKADHPVGRAFYVAIVAGCGGERRQLQVQYALDRIAIAAGCGERVQGTITRRIAAGCGDECRGMGHGASRAERYA